MLRVWFGLVWVELSWVVVGLGEGEWRMGDNGV